MAKNSDYGLMAGLDHVAEQDILILVMLIQMKEKME